MASLDFPSNPTNGQTYALNGVTYYYNSTMGAWLTQLTSMNLSTSSNTQVLFNDAGLANGSPGFVFNKVANTATVNALNTLGNLGLGTTSPNYKLQIIPSSVGSPGIYIGDGNSSNFYDGVLVQGTADGSVGGFTAFSRVDVANTTVAYVNLNYTSNYGTAFITTGNSLSFQTGQTLRSNGFDPTKTRLVITAAGNIGIGTTSPGYKLHVEGETFLGRTDSSTEGGQLSFARSSDNSLLYAIDVNGSGSSPEFRLLNQAGGTVFFSAAPAGVNYIKFNPTQMSIGDANVLDDYEEGTFTPTVAPSSGTITSYTASGVYTKIGRVVEVTVSVGITNVGTAAGAYLNVYGLPFISGSNYFIGVCRENAVNGYLSQVSLGSGATSFAILLYNNNGVLVNGGEYKMSIVYRTS